jgi:hypothetical protein
MRRRSRTRVGLLALAIAGALGTGRATADGPRITEVGSCFWPIDFLTCAYVYEDGALIDIYIVGGES